MKSISLLLLVTAVASVICNSHASSVSTAHIVGGVTNKHPTRPEVFDLNLYKDKKLVRKCKGAELAGEGLYNMWITAAECLDAKKYDNMQIKYHVNGKFYSGSFDLGGEVFHIHPQYNNVTKEHNIAIITPLLQYVGIDSRVRRFQLPKAGEDMLGKPAEVFLQWKNVTKKSDETESFEVQAVQTKIIKPSWCNFWYRWSPIKNKNVCASGWIFKGLDKNDIGIPLAVRENDDTFKLVGIAVQTRSWVHWFGFPMEFLNIEPYIEWIRGIYNVKKL